MNIDYLYSIVDLYEKKSYLGGLLVHGIPEFRLPKKVVKKTYEKIINLGINVFLNHELGKDITLDWLKERYDAIFVAIGANVSAKMGIDGEELQGVYGANELLEYKEYPEFENKTVIVSGGGNVAMDMSRTAVRLGAKKVYVVYRRAYEQMPAEEKEIKEAYEEGVDFLYQNNIVKIIGNEKVEGIECIKTELVDKGEGRLSPVNIEGSNYTIGADYVIMAIGSKLEEKIVDELAKDKWEKVIEWNLYTIDRHLKELKKKLLRYKMYINYGNVPQRYRK